MRVFAPPGVFTPLSDTRLLAERLRAEPRLRGGNVLDLCTGSGVLAVVAALAGAATVTAVDASHRSVLAARFNARLNGVRVRALRGDLFDPVAGERFDVIVSNPPYVPGEGAGRGFDAGYDGRDLIDRVCARVADHLAPGGVALLVQSSVCGERATLEALSAAGLVAEVAERRRGPLGPVMQARTPELRERGLLLDGDQEELLVLRGRAA